MKPLLNSFFISKPVLVIIILITTTCGTLLGQRYQTRSYTEADGLANSLVYSIVQDSSGVIWLGRRLGISSYDGGAFYNYNVTDGLNSGTYSFLKIDEKNQLWALPESSLVCLSVKKGNKWRTMCVRDQIPYPYSDRFTSLDVYYEQGAAVVLIGTADVGFITYSEGKWKQYTISNGLPSNIVYSVRYFQGRIYISTDKGMMQLVNGVLKPYENDGLMAQCASVLAMEPDGDIMWLLSKKSLGYLKDGTYNHVTSDFQLTINGQGWHCFIHPGRNKRVYFGNSYKVFFISEFSPPVSVLSQRNGLIAEGATAVLVDREMNTWITGYLGITKIISERFVNYSEKEGLYNNEVASALEISPGHYVFGHDGALTFFDGKKMSYIILDNNRTEPLFEKRVLDIQKDSRGNLWLAVNFLGLAYLDNNRKITWYRDKQGLPGCAFSVCVSANGTVYASTTKGLFRFYNDRFVRVDLSEMKEPSIRKIFAGTNDTIYLATLSSGLFVLKGTEFSKYTSTENKLANDVYALCMDSKKHYWVGTAAGLFELSKNSLKQVNEGALVLNRPVYLILEDNSGNLWMGTDNGVYRWNGKALAHFTVSDGLAGHDINRAAGFMDSKHELWFGTNHGLSVYRPELDYRPGQVPTPKVSLLEVINGKDTLDPNQDVVLSPDQDDLQFHTRVISFINEQKIFVKYYLEGADTSWSGDFPYYGHNSINYVNLEPGSYRFYLKARNSLGAWSDPVASARFTIKNKFWLQWWFILLVGLTLSAIVFFTFRFVLISRYKNRLQEEVNLRTLELRKSEQQLLESNTAKDSFFSIIAHDLRNPFNVILGYLELLTQDDSDFTEPERKQMLLKLRSASIRTIDLLENLLTWARSQRGSLPFEPGSFDIGELITNNINLHETSANSKKIKLLAGNNADMQVFADKNMMDAVIRNLLSNAIKFTFPGGIISIEMDRQDGNTVRVSIKDNGVGMPSEILDNLFKIEERTVNKGTANEVGTGLGLILCDEFVRKNGGTISVTSAPGVGSKFEFTIPASRS